MFLVVGLGNPGKKYEATRHNIGFAAADALRAELGLPEYKEKFSGVFSRGAGPRGVADVAVLKPQTFMNLSGGSVQPAAAFLKVAVPEILVFHDELDVPFGDVRIKQGGGHAGHNGLRSLIERLGSPDFVRVRIGIGRPPPGFQGQVADYVLSGFEASERAELPGLIARALAGATKVMTDGVQAAMTDFNRKNGVSR